MLDSLISFMISFGNVLWQFFIGAIVILIFGWIIVASYVEYSNIFAKYPYFKRKFDVSGKRTPNINDYIDEFLSNPANWEEIKQHKITVEKWHQECEKKLETITFFKEKRLEQYKKLSNDENCYCFTLYRMQTKYKQVNYQKIPYSEEAVETSVSVDYQWLSERYKRLEKIGFETCLSKYHAKNQRRLMTPALRREIMERDNYTCQICGKYMPDEVGLQIDHIVPVAKGGKTVASNLQVLCSKCNGHKSDKIVH